MNTYQLTATVTALANAIACKLDTEDIALLGAVLVMLGDTLATISTQRALCEEE